MDNKKRPADWRAFPEIWKRRVTGSALRELEAATSLAAAILFALDDAGIAGQETVVLQGRAQGGLEQRQRLGNTVAHRTSLTGEAAALDRADDIVLVHAFGNLEGLGQDQAPGRTREVFFHALAVDDHAAGAGLDPDTGHGVLAFAGGIGAAILVDHGIGKLDRLSGQDRRDRRSSFGSCGIGINHDQAAFLFLRLSAAMSKASGCCAS